MYTNVFHKFKIDTLIATTKIESNLMYNLKCIYDKIFTK